MPIRVTFVQPYLPAYRAPVYRALANEPGIDSTLVHASTPWIPNVAADGFRAVYEPMRIVHFRRPPDVLAAVVLATRDRERVRRLLRDVGRALRADGAARAGGARGDRTSARCCGGRATRDTNRGSVVGRARGWRGGPMRSFSTTRPAATLFAGDGFAPRSLFVAYTTASTRRGSTRAIAGWDASRADAFRRANSLNDGWPIALLVARLSPDRKAERLIEAAAILWSRGLRFHVAFVGQNEVAYAAKLARSSRKEASASASASRPARTTSASSAAGSCRRAPSSSRPTPA